MTLIAGLAASAQDIINSSPSPVGSGARALGMGGAFIAIADDATSASWNPGGLTQLERPELSLVYSWKSFGEEFASTYHLEPDGGMFDVDMDDINYFSYVYPIKRTFAGRNFVLSLNYQKKFDFDRSLDLRAREISPGITPIETVFDIKYRQDGGLSSLSPAFGFEITDQLSMGIAMNIFDSDLLPGNEWKIRNEYRSRFNVLGGASPIYGAGRTDDDFTNYEATNFTIGALYKPNDRWSIGAVYHTAYTAEVDNRQIKRTYFPIQRIAVKNSHFKYEWPEALGIGAAYRFPNDKLTLSLDVTWRPWDDFVKTDNHATSAGRKRVSPITGLPKSQSPHDDTWTVRLGGEYVFVDETKPRQDYLYALRAGLFYDPEPASGRKDSFFGTLKGNGEPDDYYGFAIGGGVLIKSRVNIDAAYQYRFGNGVRRDTFAGAGVFETNFSEDVQQHYFYLSTVIYF